MGVGMCGYGLKLKEKIEQKNKMHVFHTRVCEKIERQTNKQTAAQERNITVLLVAVCCGKAVHTTSPFSLLPHYIRPPSAACVAEDHVGIWKSTCYSLILNPLFWNLYKNEENWI